MVFGRDGMHRVDANVFFWAVAIGFAVAAPIGPVGLMCIRKALGDGRLAAWIAGLGAALADTLFGSVVGLGLGTVSDTLLQYESHLTVVGGAFMLFLGVRGWKAAAIDMQPAPRGGGLAQDFLTTFTITLTNPGTILGIIGVFAALGTPAHPDNPQNSILLVVGLLCGSSLWWAVLTEITILARAKLSKNAMRLFNHVSGALLMVFGILALSRLFW